MEKFIVYKNINEGSKIPLIEFNLLNDCISYIATLESGTYSIEKVTPFGSEIIG